MPMTLIYYKIVPPFQLVRSLVKNVIHKSLAPSTYKKAENKNQQNTNTRKHL